MKFTPGVKYFYCTLMMGAQEIIFIKEDKHERIFKWPSGRKYALNKNSLNSIYKTSDEAEIEFYKRRIHTVQKKLAQRRNAMLMGFLKELQEKEKPLKEKYPEDYI